MRRIIVTIFIFLSFLCSCSEKSETAVDWINKADTLWHGGKYTEPQKAIEYLSKAIELQPDNSSIYNRRGSIYLTTGQNQLAINDLDKAIRLNPANAEYYNNRGSIFEKTGRYQQAIKDFDEAIHLEPKTVIFYNNRGTVQLDHGDKKTGCVDAHKACELKFCELLEWAKKEGYCR